MNISGTLSCPTPPPWWFFWSIPRGFTVAICFRRVLWIDTIHRLMPNIGISVLCQNGNRDRSGSMSLLDPQLNLTKRSPCKSDFGLACPGILLTYFLAKMWISCDCWQNRVNCHYYYFRSSSVIVVTSVPTWHSLTRLVGRVAFFWPPIKIL